MGVDNGMVAVQVSAELYMKEHVPVGRRLKLDPYATELAKLVRHGYSLSQMCEYLSLNGIEVSARTVARFLHNRMNQKSVPATTTATAGEGVAPAASTSVPVAGVASTSDVAQLPPRITKYSAAPIAKPNIDLRDESTWPKPEAGAASGTDGVQRPVGTAEEGVVPDASIPVPAASVASTPDVASSPPQTTKFCPSPILKRNIDLRDESTW